MGQTVEIDHQRDLFWAEAVLRDGERERDRAETLARIAS